MPRKTAADYARIAEFPELPWCDKHYGFLPHMHSIPPGKSITVQKIDQNMLRQKLDKPIYIIDLYDDTKDWFSFSTNIYQGEDASQVEQTADIYCRILNYNGEGS